MRRPIEVYVNGVEQKEGADYELIGASLVFQRVLTPEPPTSYWRWALLFLGVWSSFRRHDTVVVVHRPEGRTVVETIPASAYKLA